MKPILKPDRPATRSSSTHTRHRSRPPTVRTTFERRIGINVETCRLGRRSIPLDVRGLPREFVGRPALIEQLVEARDQVVLIVAPAGFGKTSLLAEWQRFDDRRWIWLEPRDVSMGVADRRQMVVVIDDAQRWGAGPAQGAGRPPARTRWRRVPDRARRPERTPAARRTTPSARTVAGGAACGSAADARGGRSRCCGGPEPNVTSTPWRC